MIEVEGTGPYTGWDVKLNGVPMYHKPYDGSDAEQAAEQFLEVLGTLVRQESGFPEIGEEGDGDD
jgi:hypothetical protein